MPVVTMPDGQVVDLPDNPTTGQLAELDKLTAPAKPSGAQESLRRLKLLGSGLARGAAGLPALGVDAANLVARALVGESANGKGLAASEAIGKFGEQPRGTGEGYLNAALQGVGGALTGPGVIAAPLRTAVVGGLAGLGGEAGAEATDGSLIGRLLGGLAGGGVPSLLSGLSKTRASLAQEATRDAKPADMRAAADLMRAGQQEGVSLNLSQAMPTASNLDKMVETLAQSRHGVDTARQLRAQPNDVAMLAERQVAGLPGAVRAPTDAATNLQEAASGAIEGLTKQRGDLWKSTLAGAIDTLEKSKQPAIDMASAQVRQLAQSRQQLQSQLVAAHQALLQGANPQTVAQAVQAATASTAATLKEAAARSTLAVAEQAQKDIGKIPSSLVGKEVNRLTRMADTMPNTPKGAAIRQLANDLMVDGKPITGAEQLNEIFKATNRNLTQPTLTTPGMDKATVGAVQGEIAELRKRFGEAAQPFREANAAYAQATESLVNPARASITGRIAGARGFDASKEMAPARMNALFDAGTVPGATKSEILTLEKAVRGQPNGPEAFQDAAKTWMATRTAKATTGTGGRTDEGTAARLASAFIGDKTREAGLKDTMVALARSQGLPDDALAPGMLNAMRIIEAAGRRGDVAGTSAKQLEMASTSRLAGSVQSFSLIQPFRQLGRVVNDALNKDAMTFMDKLVTSPEGVETLIKLGKQPVMSKAALNTLATFMGTLGQASAVKPDRINN